MSWMTAVDQAVESVVAWRRRRRGVKHWQDEPWRVERALAEGIRFSDEELLQIGLGNRMEYLSYNEALRATELAAPFLQEGGR